MSDNIIPFNNGNEENEPCCETCETTNEYFSYLLDAESLETKYEILRDFAEECKKIGMKELLLAQLESKAEMLDHLEYRCCDEDDC